MYVYVSMKKIHEIRRWRYRVCVNGNVFDEFYSKEQLDTRDLLEVQENYRNLLEDPEFEISKDNTILELLERYR